MGNYKYVKEYRRKQFEWLIEQKKSPCADCEVEYPHYVMDFDHVRGEKSFNLQERNLSRGRETIQAEIEKCDLVCANCHRERTQRRLARGQG